MNVQETTNREHPAANEVTSATVLPLEGIRIVDFGWVYAAPIATRSARRHGRRGDQDREHGAASTSCAPAPATSRATSSATPVFHDLNRNKLSLAVDFAPPRGRWR